MTDLSVNLKKTVNAPIDTVFDAWLDPALLRQFILPAPGMPSPEVSNEPHEGGRFEIIMQVGDDKLPHSGTYLTIDRPTRLVFSWESAFSTDDSRVTLDFSAIDEVTTRVELTQVIFVDETSRSSHEGGWRTILDCLEDKIGSG